MTIMSPKQTSLVVNHKTDQNMLDTKLVLSVHEAKKSFKCNICGHDFALEKNLKSHIDAVHLKLKSFDCKICKKSFAKKHNMEDHISSVHEENRPRVTCSYCDELFSSKSSLSGNNYCGIKLELFTFQMHRK